MKQNLLGTDLKKYFAQAKADLPAKPKKKLPKDYSGPTVWYSEWHDEIVIVSNVPIGKWGLFNQYWARGKDGLDVFQDAQFIFYWQCIGKL